MTPARRDRSWNHNTAYESAVLAALPVGARDVLDVGCGEGTLARSLAAVVPHVTGIDTDPASIERARRACETASPDFLVRDVLTDDVGGPFDAVVCVATLHHLPTEEALGRLRALVRPGGSLIVVGCARSRLPRDLPWELAASVVHHARRLRAPYWDHGSPTTPPSETYREVRTTLARALPGVVFRRRLLWRYTATWTKPGRLA